MRYVPADKYNVAWFKLAECVSRGEKERALGVYRLLAHSFDDPAFAQQLEGDILLSFNDQETAVDRYNQAALLYKQSGRILESAAVYEQLVTLVAHKYEYIATLIQLYLTIKLSNRLLFWFSAFTALPHRIDGLMILRTAMEHVDTLALDAAQANAVRQDFIITWLKNEGEYSMITEYIVQHIQELSLLQDSTQLQQFVMLTSQLSQPCHDFITAHLQNADITA